MGGGYGRTIAVHRDFFENDGSKDMKDDSFSVAALALFSKLAKECAANSPSHAAGLLFAMEKVGMAIVGWVDVWNNQYPGWLCVAIISEIYIKLW